MNHTDDPTIDGIARRTFIKGGALLGATALLAGGTGSVAAQEAPPATLESELEGPITAVDVENQTIEVMGITADASGAPIASPTASLSIDQLLGDSLPGRTESGFMGGTGIVVGTTTTGDDDYTVDASSVTVEVAENVIVGAVTENTLQGETFDSGGSFKVQGVEIRPTNDERIPFSAGVAGLPVDMSTVDMGTLAGPEGHIGNDGVLYAHTLEVEGELVEGDHTSILRVRCADGGRLEIRGASSSQTGSVTVYDDSTGAVIGTTAVEPDEELGIGSYRFRQDVTVCPMVVRVENSNGSSATFNLPTATPVPGEEPEPEEPPEDPGATVQTLAIQGSGERASYEFIVDGEVTGLDLTSEDRVVDGERAIGAVGGGTDHYEFTGTLLSVEVNGPATVMLDGEPYPIDQPLDNTLSIRGNDDRAEYTFTVSGDLLGGSLTGEDEIDGSTATGAVRRGQDTYHYSGEVTAFEFTQGVATVRRNGQVVTDPTQP